MVVEPCGIVFKRVPVLYQMAPTAASAVERESLFLVYMEPRQALSIYSQYTLRHLINGMMKGSLSHKISLLRLSVRRLSLVLCLSALPCMAFADPAANWMVETHDGSQLSLNDELANGKKVVAIFWATWCGYCRQLLPKLDQLHSDSANENVRFVAMNIWEDKDPLTYIKETALSLPVVLNAEAIASKYGVKGTPAVFVIGENNKILYQRQTGQSPDEVIAAIKKVLIGTTGKGTTRKDTIKD